MRPEYKKVNIHKVKKIVFNGGGTKGPAHTTAYAAFITCGGDVDKIDGVGGTSAGSIMAGFVAVGCTITELQEENLRDFMQFLDEDSGFIKVSKKVTKTSGKLRTGQDTTIAMGPILLAGPTIKDRVSKNIGIFKGEALRLWVEGKIKEKTNVDHCTFLELHKLAEKDKHFKDLYTVAVNTNTKTIEYFNYQTTPNVVISDALRASSSIPIFFEACHIYTKDPHSRRRIPTTDRYVDGGVVNNYPVNIFMGQSDKAYEEVLGFYLCDTDLARYLKGEGALPEMPVDSGWALIKSLGWTLFDQQYASFMADKKSQACTIPIDNTGVSAIDFDLSNRPEELQALLQSGWQATCDYFNKNVPFPSAAVISRKNGLEQYTHNYHLQYKANNASSNSNFRYGLMFILLVGGGYLMGSFSKEMSVKDVFLYGFMFVGIVAVLNKSGAFQKAQNHLPWFKNLSCFRPRIENDRENLRHDRAHLFS